MALPVERLKKGPGSSRYPPGRGRVRLAEATGKALKDVPFDICFTSPLKRARQTAELILGERKVPVIRIKGSRRSISAFWREPASGMGTGNLSAEKWRSFFKIPAIL